MAAKQTEASNKSSSSKIRAVAHVLAIYHLVSHKMYLSYALSPRKQTSWQLYVDTHKQYKDAPNRNILQTGG